MQPRHLADDLHVNRRFLGDNLTDGQLNGTTDDVVVRWTRTTTTDEQGYGSIGSVFDVSTTPANGTRVGLRRRGVYHVAFGISFGASVSLAMWLTRDTPTDPLAAGNLNSLALGTGDEPNNIIAQNVWVIPAADNPYGFISGICWVSNADAAAVGTPNGCVVRCHFSTTAGATPADVDVATNGYSFCRITYIGDNDT